jgi:hypothetical protein
LGNEEFPMTEDDEKSKHPTIIKNSAEAEPSAPLATAEATVSTEAAAVTWTKDETAGKEEKKEAANADVQLQPDEEEKKPLQE